MTQEAPLPSERRAQLIARVRETGSARVSDLSRWLGVTPVTVRRDLAVLVADGALEKVHGGARVPAAATSVGATTGVGAAGVAATTTSGATAPAGSTAAGPPAGRGAHAPAATGVPAPEGRFPDRDERPTIGMVVPSLDYYWPEVIRGARAATHDTARLILRGGSYDVDHIRHQLASLVGDRGDGTGVDGLLVAPPAGGPESTELADWLAGLDLPVVLMERRLAAGPYREPLESVATDHALGAGTAVRHLAERGHRKVGLVTSRTSPHTSAVERGFRAAVEDLGLDAVLDVETVPQSDPAWSDDVAAVLDRCADAEATALLVHSDREAISLVEHAQERGIRVPADLAVVAYDDEVAALADPPLTAVRPPKAAIGAAAVELVRRRLADGDDRPVHRIELSPRLLVRSST